jgi:hypothetical protein
MLKEIYVRSSAELEDGSPMFPGTWVETWILLPGTGAWMLLSFRPAPEVEVAALARACGRMMNQRRSPPLELLPPLFRRKLLDHEDAEAGFR